MTDPEFEDVGSVFVRIAEEAGEIVQEAIKCERFGPDGQHPNGGMTNEERLKAEIEDLYYQTRKLDDESTTHHLSALLTKWDVETDELHIKNQGGRVILEPGPLLQRFILEGNDMMVLSRGDLCDCTQDGDA